MTRPPNAINLQLLVYCADHGEPIPVVEQHYSENMQTVHVVACPRCVRGESPTTGKEEE